MQAPLVGADHMKMEKIMRNLMLGTAIAVVFGASASAQDLFRTEMDPVAITASDFIGKRVYAAEVAVDADEYAGVQDGWNDIGEINDVILTRDGRVDAVLVDIGGFLGMGERQVAVGMESIRFVSDGATAEDVNDYFLVVNADRATLEGAPDFMRTGALPAEMADPTDTANDAPAMTNIPGVDEATGAANTDVATTEPSADGNVTAGGKMVEGYAAVDLTGLTTEQLIGARVHGPNDEEVGEISEVVLDADGALGQVIIDVGGFLGIGQKPVAIEMNSVQILQATDGETLRVYVPMTQEELEQMPATSM
jgi:sporulation protein YlmC with PRC-barrel domain